MNQKILICALLMSPSLGILNLEAAARTVEKKSALTIDVVYARYARTYPSEGLTASELAQFLLDNAKEYRSTVSPHGHTPEQVSGAKRQALELVDHETWGMSSKSNERIMSKEAFRNYGSAIWNYAHLDAQDEQIGGPPKKDIVATATAGVVKSKNLHIGYSAGAGPGPEDQSARPAQASWTTQKRFGPSTFAVDGAISYDQTLGFSSSSFLYLSPSFEAHVSNAKTNQENSLTAALALNYEYANLDEMSPYRGNFLSLTPNFQTDRKTNLETYGVNLLYSPKLNLPFDLTTYGGIFLLPNNHRALVLDVQPTIGLEGGQAIKFPKSTPYADDKDFVRAVAKLHVDLEIVNQLWVSLDYVHRTFLNGSNESYDFVSFSPVVYPNGFIDYDGPSDPKKPKLSLGMTFKFGKTTPSFNNVASIGAWIGVKY